ncbi:hypothetical protein Tco_0884460 [Tanacetum coccineum]
MAFSVILISSDSSEESMRTSTARVILFDTIPTTIPPTTPTINLLVIHDETLLTPIISPTIPPVAPTIQYTSSFINTDSSDSDTPDSPSSPFRQILPTPPRLPRRPAVLSVGSLPTHRLASRYPSDSSSDSSLRHSSSGYAISETSCDSPTLLLRGHLARNVGPYQYPYLHPSEDGYEPYVPIEVGLGVDVEDSYEPYTEPDINSDIQEDIDECITYVDAIRARGMDDRDVVETAAKEEVEFRERHKIPFQPDSVIESEQRLQRHRITGVDLEVTTMTKGISALKQDNTRLRGMLDVDNPQCITFVIQKVCNFYTYRNNPRYINELITQHVDEALMAYEAELKQKLKKSNKKTTLRKTLTMRTVTGMGMETPMFRELTLLCTKIVPKEKDKVEKYIGCLPDNIQGNVIAAEPTRL